MANNTYQSDRTGSDIDTLLDYLDRDVREKINEFDKEMSLKASDSEVVKLDTKNKPNGYLGLDENGKFDDSFLKGDEVVKTRTKNQPNGYLGLDSDCKFDSSFIKDGDFVKISDKNKPNGYLGLDEDGKFDDSFIKGEQIIKSDMKDKPNGYAGLDDKGKINSELVEFGRGNEVGLKTEQGGEVFNNYADNKALAPFATSNGSVTQAGGKAFRINNIQQNSGTSFTVGLNTTKGLRVGDVCSVMLSSFAPECGSIVEMTNTSITLKGKIPDDVLEKYKYDLHLEDPEKNILRPIREFGDDDIGDVYVGSFSNAGGRYTRTFGIASKSDGKFTTAESSYADAGGYGTRAGYGAMSRGLNTYAKGHYSIADGDETLAEGHTSRAHRKGSVASAQFAVADGFFVKARSVLQRVFGKYNVEDDKGKYEEIVGAGYVDYDGIEHPKNIRTLDWNGLGWYRKGIKIGGENQDDPNAVDVLTSKDSLEIYSKIDLEAKNSQNIFSNTLVGNVKAEVIATDDVSTLEHDLELSVHSKNIFKNTNYQGSNSYEITIDGWSHGQIGNSDPYKGVFNWVSNNDDNWSMRQFIPVSSPITISAEEHTTYSVYIYCYSEAREESFIKRLDRVISKISDFSNNILPEGTRYIRIMLVKSGQSNPNLLVSNVMIEEGTVATSYTPHVNPTEAKIKVCKGKNLSPISKVNITNDSKGYAQITSMPHGTYTVSCDVTKYSDDEATNTRVAIGVAYDTGAYNSNGSKIYSYVWSYSDVDTNNIERDGVSRRKTASITTNPDSPYSLWAIMIRTSDCDSAGTNRNAKAENIILIKEDDTNKTYAINSDETVDGANSVSPDMIIYADKAGTIIDCKYNKDANKVIEKLTNAIISLGGNV